MTIALRSAAAVIVFSFTLSGCSKQTPDAAAPERPNDGTVESIISIKFSKKAYTFTLAEVAKGIRIDYTISIKQDIDGVAPRPQDDGSASGSGPSGLYPFEEISGNGHSYSLRDIGLAPPHDLPPRTIKKGKHSLSFEWDGRNWTGPSDFNNPKGDPFPSGSYTLTVRIVGKMEDTDGTNPYDVASSVEVMLVP
jgi:hypothetical protein